MPLPEAVETLWSELQAVRAEILAEAEGLTQAQSEWRPGAKEWSVGEVIHHLTVTEIANGKLTTKLTREAEAAGRLAPFPPELREFAPLPAWPPGPMEAPQPVWPEHGKPIGELLQAIRATRERSRQSIEKLASVDPRGLVFKHFRLGDLDLGQWWRLLVQHDGIHLGQIRAIKGAPGFPRA
jgi:hypothetical protein